MLTADRVALRQNAIRAMSPPPKLPLIEPVSAKFANFGWCGNNIAEMLLVSVLAETMSAMGRRQTSAA